MKYLLVLLGLIGLLTKTSIAYTPMEELPLKERVARASEVFIGVIEKVIVVDEDNREITDDKLIPELVNSIILQVRVEESLTSPKWLPTKPVIVGYGGMWMRIKDDRDAYTGKNRSSSPICIIFSTGDQSFTPVTAIF